MGVHLIVTISFEGCGHATNVKPSVTGLLPPFWIQVVPDFVQFHVEFVTTLSWWNTYSVGLHARAQRSKDFSGGIRVSVAAAKFYKCAHLYIANIFFFLPRVYCIILPCFSLSFSNLFPMPLGFIQYKLLNELLLYTQRRWSCMYRLEPQYSITGPFMSTCKAKEFAT